MHAARSAALVVLAAVAGCGGSTAAPSRQAAVAPAAATSTAAPKAKAKTVKIKDFDYSPRTLHVAKGTKVTWKNTDEANHTVTFKTGPGNLGNFRPGGKHTTRFTRTGTYAYICQYHPNMKGKVVVS